MATCGHVARQHVHTLLGNDKSTAEYETAGPTVTEKQFHKIIQWSELELNLRPTVSRPVCLGVGPPFGGHNQILHVI
jgi:hypothetical protein